MPKGEIVGNVVIDGKGDGKGDIRDEREKKRQKDAMRVEQQQHVVHKSCG